ncbi:MAG TPA: long-chain fatty acid--CoA ligase [Ktedonobacteraceae bacterium]
MTTSIRDQDLQVLYDLSVFNCKNYGSFTQLIYEDPQRVRKLTNVDVASTAAQLSAGLHTLGVEKGDRVLVMMPNCPEVVVAYQGIARAGAVIIPVLPVLKAPEVRYIAANSEAKAVITSALLLPLLQAALDGVPTMRFIISTDLPDQQQNETTAQPRVVAFERVVEMGHDEAQRYLSHLSGVEVGPDDRAVILYTSGTTGRPKGVVLTHRSLVANAIGSRDDDAVQKEGRSEEIQLAVLPLAHAYGIVVLNVGCLTGASLVMHPRFEPVAVLSAIERHRITGFAGVPAMFTVLLNTPDADKYDTSSLQYCVSGSAPLPLPVLQGFEQKFHCPIREGYGLSEAAAVLTATPSNIERKPGSVGKPLAGVEVRIVDEHDKSLPAGETGEIVARGPNIMSGYYDLPEETAAALRDGWLYTGDMGYFDSDGFLYVVERKKDLIIRGGFNIYPRDVEEVLASHPAVIEAAVVGVPSERMGEEVKAFVVTRTPVDAETLMAYCQEKLANYKTPSQIEFLEALPRNSVGKIDKKVLRK